MHTALDGRLNAFAALLRDSVARQDAQLAGRCEDLDERFQAGVARCREHQRLLSEAVRLNEHEAARELKAQAADPSSALRAGERALTRRCSSRPP